MKKIILMSLFLYSAVFSLEIPQEHAQLREFGKSVELNAQIIQLSNSSQSVMSQVSGHIEKYYVKAGERIKNGQKIVLIESIMLSKMTANFISQKKQLHSLEKNYAATQNLYKKGMTSLQSLNLQSIERDELLSSFTALKSQLKTLGVDTSKLTKATSNFILYAHSDGVVSKVLQALHSGIQEDTPIISMVKEQAYYVKSFLPLEYASKVRVGQKSTLKVNGKMISSYITQILPEVDEVTQRIVLLSSINEKTDNLYINTYLAVTLHFDDTKKHVAVNKSALSFFQNEWVVFVPREEEQGHEKHESDDKDEHKGHDHDEEEVLYELRVVKVITQDDNYVAVEGLSVGEEYVSAKSYYVKSMLLKSSLGGHGH
ncbi:MAG: cobalt-zinc-cadmium efflux system membrane fusion protein [Sulfurimonas sp.]|jgi:cobalt-zinc-cadmium efflux system membrane fusion protein|uniref:efflux RND transporter periplasmic adaptor subunit n=1 Tax=Sulfurimonas sp. TaxID=2022749 RepID=UPI0039E66423